MARVPGWFSATDAWVFAGISGWQQEVGIDGDLLEIGVYQGRSALLLGHLLGDGQRLVLCDLFDQPGGSSSPSDGPAGYTGLTLDGFLARYRRHHRQPPVVHQCRSETLSDLESTKTFRMIHIDGSHRYEDVRSDIDLVPSLLLDEGIVVLDDYRALHTPGVSAAIWEAVVNDNLRPICLTADKMYASWGPPRPETGQRIRHILESVASLEVIEDRVCDSNILVALPKGYGADPPRGARRLMNALVPPALATLPERVRARSAARSHVER